MCLEARGKDESIQHEINIIKADINESKQEIWTYFVIETSNREVKNLWTYKENAT